jgi:ABC-type Na+ efflux pump permease subunit
MKKIITLLTIVSSILFLSLPVSALDQKKEIIKLDNGYYLETIIEETSMARAANQKTARKTANYKNAQGAIMFSVTVTGTFTYTGSSSTCTKSVAKNTNWKISSKSASKSGNKATAKAIAKRYVDGVAVETQNCTVTLICSSNGSLK